MAKRRLNKKVALIGSVVLAIMALATIWIILRLSRDPHEFIRDAEQALAEQDYKAAESSLRAAYGSAKDNELRKDILFRLVDMYVKTDQWPFARWCWGEIIRIDDKNAQARYCQLMYSYIWAESSGRSDSWPQVREQASEFIKRAEGTELFSADPAKWETFSTQDRGDITYRTLGPLLYLIRGRASLEMTISGVAANKDETLSQAVADLQKVLELEPDNTNAYQHLAEAAIERGRILYSRGSFTERDKILSEATALLEKGVQTARDKPQAHINLLMMKLGLARTTAQAKERITALEPEYIAVMGKFPNVAAVHAAVSDYYSDYAVVASVEAGAQMLAKAIETCEKACQADPQNVTYVINAANLNYRMFSLYGDKQHVSTAIDLAEKGLTLPGSQETRGPRIYANLANRYTLHSLIAHCAIEQILEPSERRNDEQTEAWLKKAEEAVHAIEQVQGGRESENPQVLQWRGMLALAKGQKKTAVRNLYSAYEQLRAMKPTQPPWPVDLRFGHLAYTLAKVFKDSSEIGASIEFMTDALNSYVATIKPQARLDYAEAALKFSQWEAVRENIGAFESRFGPTDRSRQLRIQADIGAGEFDKAGAALNERSQNDPNTIKLSLQLARARIRQLRMAVTQKQRQDGISLAIAKDKKDQADTDDTSVQLMTADLNKYRDAEAQLVEKLWAVEPNSVGYLDLVSVGARYVEAGQKDKAIVLAERLVKRDPNDTNVLAYREMLGEPDPQNIPEERQREIQIRVLSSISDAARKAYETGVFYRIRGEREKALAEFKKVLALPYTAAADSEALLFEQSEVTRVRRGAAGYIFDMAIEDKNMGSVEQIASQAQQEDLDGCGGLVFAARLAIAKGQYQDALARVDECIKQHPVFSRAYMLRSNINAALANETKAVDDIRKAATLNPLDGTIAKGLADVLYRRNRRLGANVSPVEVVETRNALEAALSLNPRDVMLLNLYAEFVSTSEPLRAVAILQELVRIAPTMEHALRLGKLATDVGTKQDDPKIKKLLFDIAGVAYEQGRQIDPNNQTMLHLYAEHFRVTGRDEQAKDLLTAAKNEKLLWNHYFERGQYDQAKQILDRLYGAGQKDRPVIAGSLLVAEATGDTGGVRRFSDELIALDPKNAENYLIQIQSFLKVGLVTDAERKLESFTEKFPDEPRTLMLRSWLSMRQGQLDQALALANKNLEIDQANPAGWRLRGEIYLFMANYTQAINDLQKSKSLLNEPATRVSLAKAYLQQRRYEDAITELKNTVDTPGAPLEARTQLEYIYLRLDRKDALKEFYNETLERFPDDVGWLNRAGSFAIDSGDLSRAEQLFEKACKVASDARGSQNTRDLLQDGQYLTVFDGYLRALVAAAGVRGTAKWDPGKLDRVFEEGRKFADTDFAPIVFFRMAQAKIKLGERDTAVQYCRKAVDLTGDNETLASEVMLRMYLMLGAEEVEKYCQERLAVNPNLLAANYTMFNLAKVNGEFNKALSYVDKCIKLSEPNSSRWANFIVKKAETLTLAYERSSDNKYLQMAIADYESLLGKMPNNISVLNNLAYMLAESNQRLAEALQYAERAVGLRPDDPSILDTYAYVLHKNGKNQQAVEKLTAALMHYEQNKAVAPPEVYGHLGMVREQLGAKSQALVAYRQALDSGAETLSDKAKERLNEAIKRVSQ